MLASLLSEMHQTSFHFLFESFRPSTYSLKADVELPYFDDHLQRWAISAYHLYRQHFSEATCSLLAIDTLCPSLDPGQSKPSYFADVACASITVNAFCTHRCATGWRLALSWIARPTLWITGGSVWASAGLPKAVNALNLDWCSLRK